MADHVGQQIGNYRLLQLLGRGGYADVYLGKHIYLGTQAAIKVLHGALTPQELQNFLKEAQNIAKLKHPNIVRVLEFGLDNTNLPYFIMDYALHGTLRNCHPLGSILQFETLLPYVKQIATALQYAHNQKLIHRDVKPENILIDANNTLLLSDFGIAVAAHRTRSLDIQDAIGTIPYMAPEQISGKPRPATDQYALGIMVYTWLCGAYPFTGTDTEILSQHLAVLPPHFGRDLHISSQVEQVVIKALAKDPHQRFESVQAFADALENASQTATQGQQQGKVFIRGATTPQWQNKGHAATTEKIPTQPLVPVQQPIILKNPRSRTQTRAQIAQRVSRFDDMILEPCHTWQPYEVIRDDVISGFSPNGKLIMLRQNDQNILYDPAKNTKRILPISDWDISLSKAQKYILSRGDVYDIHTGAKVLSHTNGFIEWLHNDRYVANVIPAYDTEKEKYVIMYLLFDLFDPKRGSDSYDALYDIDGSMKHWFFSPNNTYLAIHAIDDRRKGRSYIYDVLSGKIILARDGRNSYNFSHWLSDNNCLISEEHSAFVYDISTGVAIQEIKTTGVYSISSVSPDRQYAIVYKETWFLDSADQTYLMDTQTGTIIHDIPNAYKDVDDITSQWSPDGKYVVITNYSTEKVFFDLYLIRPAEIVLKKRITFPKLAKRCKLVDLFSNGCLIRYVRGEVGQPLELVEIYEE